MYQNKILYFTAIAKCTQKNRFAVDHRVDFPDNEEWALLVKLLLMNLVKAVDGGVSNEASGDEVDEDDEVESNDIILKKKTVHFATIIQTRKRQS